MLSSLVKEHNQHRKLKETELEKKRLSAIQATNVFSDFVLDRLNKDVSEAFVNQKKIDAKVKQLDQNSNHFIKQTNRWIILLDQFNTSLKELGDVENWAKKIESDMKIIHSTLEIVLENETTQN